MLYWHSYSIVATLQNLPLLICLPFKQGIHIPLPRMRRIRRSGGEFAARWLQLMEQLINLNAMISGRTSISLRLSRRLFISLSEIGWRICERLVGGRKPAASVPKRWHRCPQDNQTVPRKKKKIKNAFTTSERRLNEAVHAEEETQTLRLKSYQFAAAEDLEAVAIVLYFIWMQPLGSTGLLELSKY